MVTAYRARPPAVRRAAPPGPGPPRRPPARRHVRPRRHRPAHLPDRPLQPALHVLHARRGPGLDAARRAAHRRRAGPADRDRGPRPRRRTSCGSPAASRCCAAASRASSRRRRRCGPRPDISLTTNGDRPRPPRRGAGRGRGGPAQRLAGHAAPGPVRHDHPPRPALRRARRASPPPAPRASTPIKINTVLLRGVNDDEAVAAAAVRRRARLRAALHRADAARRPARLAARRDGHRRRDPARRCAGDFTLTPDPAERGGAPAERWLVDGGPAVVGVIASVTRPFCGACDRTRLTADGQVRSCLFARTETDLRGAAARRRRPTRRSPTPGATRCGASSPGTASTTPASCSRTAR